jgi:N-acetylglucosaminyldiphosphoundecaprenol N-acetyl-beta-D-mannosaminyltransferase
MAPCLTFDKVNILGIGVHAINMQQALDQMTCWIEQKRPNYIIVCPVYTIMAARRDPILHTTVQQAGLVTPDGMPLVFISRWLGYKHVTRVYGPDLLLAFSQLSAEKGYRNYYFGGVEGVPEKLADSLTSRFQGLQVVGTYSPPFRPLTAEEEQITVERINAAKPDIVWVCLGSPKQDLWVAKFRDRLDAPILIGVGAAFDFLSGRKPQAPRWMQRSALEWLFRLLTEPRRLWRRYLINNPLFMLLVTLQFLKIRRFPLD